MKKAVRTILERCLGLRENERLLVVTDQKMLKVAKPFYEEGRKTANAKLLKIPVGKVNGEEPPKRAAIEMLKHDVELLITHKSLSHTKARKQASSGGARIATMPGATKEMIGRAADIDYVRLKKTNKALADLLDKGSKVRITTKKGTDISFSIRGRKAFGRESGIFTKSGSFGNLPEGEAFIAPLEGTADGLYVVDASFAGLGKIKKGLKVFVEKGLAVRFEGEKSKKLEKIISSAGKKAGNIAEFGIGTNPKARVTGRILEDEKVKGTCHIALGNNKFFGGKVNVPIHVDGVIKRPTIYIDNRKIMGDGRLALES